MNGPTATDWVNKGLVRASHVNARDRNASINAGSTDREARHVNIVEVPSSREPLDERLELLT